RMVCCVVFDFFLHRGCDAVIVCGAFRPQALPSASGVAALRADRAPWFCRVDGILFDVAGRYCLSRRTLDWLSSLYHRLCNRGDQRHVYPPWRSHRGADVYDGNPGENGTVSRLRDSLALHCLPLSLLAIHAAMGGHSCWRAAGCLGLCLARYLGGLVVGPRHDGAIHYAHLA